MPANASGIILAPPRPAIPEAKVSPYEASRARPERIETGRSFQRAFDYARTEFRGKYGVTYTWARDEPERRSLHTLPDRPGARCRIAHGLIRGGLPYGWVEFDGIVFDPGYQRFYDRAAWYAAVGAEKAAEYTIGHADRLLQEHHTYGPWPADGSSQDSVV